MWIRDTGGHKHPVRIRTLLHKWAVWLWESQVTPRSPALSSFSQFGSDHKFLVHSDGFNRKGLTIETVYPTAGTINKAAEEVSHQGQHFRRLCQHLPLAKRSREAWWACYMGSLQAEQRAKGGEWPSRASGGHRVGRRWVECQYTLLYCFGIQVMQMEFLFK